MKHRISALERNSLLTLTFSDGSVQTVQTANDYLVQEYALVPVLTTSVRVTVSTVYGTVNNGFAELEFGTGMSSYKNKKTVLRVPMLCSLLMNDIYILAPKPRRFSLLFVTLCLILFLSFSPLSSHLISSHLISSHLISSHLISSHLMSSHAISSHLISSHLISSHLVSSHLISSHLISSHLISSNLILAYLPRTRQS